MIVGALSLAALKHKLSGVTAQALGAALALAVVAAAVVGGLWWIRHDARLDERNGWALRMAKAQRDYEAKLEERNRHAREIAAHQANEWAEALAQSEAARQRAENMLASFKGVRVTESGRVVCWPKEIVEDLNR